MNEEMVIYPAGSYIPIDKVCRSYSDFGHDCVVTYVDDIMYLLTVECNGYMRLWVHFLHENIYHERRHQDITRRFYHLGLYGRKENWDKMPQQHVAIAEKMVEFAQNTLLTTKLLSGV
jgi:hypothetical protein